MDHSILVDGVDAVGLGADGFLHLSDTRPWCDEVEGGVAPDAPEVSFVVGHEDAAGLST